MAIGWSGSNGGIGEVILELSEIEVSKIIQLWEQNHGTRV